MSEDAAQDSIRKTRLKKIGLIFLALYALYILVTFFAVPAVVKSQLQKLGQETLQREISIGGVSFNPLTISLSVQSLEIRDPDGERFVAFDEFLVDVQLSSIVRVAPTFSEIALRGPYVRIARDENGRFNFADLLETDESAPEPEEESGELPSLVIFALDIAGGTVHFRDATRAVPFVTDLTPIALSITDFSTRRGEDSPYAFSASTGRGETLEWEGSLAINPVRSSGRFSLKNIRARQIWEYLREFVNFEVTEGQIAVGAAYEAAVGGNSRVFDGTFRLSDLDLREVAGEESMIAVPQLEVNGIGFDLDEQKVTVGKVSTSGGIIAAANTPEGGLNLQRLFTPVAPAAQQEAVASEEESASADDDSGQEPATESEQESVQAAPEEQPADTPDQPKEPPTEPESPPWKFTLGGFELSEYEVSWNDTTVEPAAQLSLTQLAATTGEIAVPEGKAFPVTLDTNIGGSPLSAQGTAALDPFSLGLAIDLAGLALKPAEGYVRQGAKLTLESGSVDVKGTLTANENEQEQLRIGYAGLVHVLGVATSAAGGPFAGVEALRLDGIDLKTAPLELAVDSIEIQGPNARVAIDAEGVSNLSRIFPVGPSKKAAPKESGLPPQIAIDTVTLTGGEFVFTDETLEPPFSFKLADLAGGVRGLSSKTGTNARVDLTANINAHAPLTVSGTINPLAAQASSDLLIDAKGINLTSFSPYSGKFAGYVIDKGKLNLDLAYQLDKRILTGENKIFIDQFEFGAKTDSPDATNLPVKLGVTLLKDRKGEIHLDVDVRGDLDDPEFSATGLLVDTLLNILTKVTTSPFAALGSVAGAVTGGAEELGHVTFTEGSAALSLDERTQLSQVAAALREKSSLTLEIQGAAGAEQAALQRRRVEEAVHARYAADEGLPQPAPVPPDAAREILSDLYEERFDESRRRLRNRLRAEREGLPVLPPDEEQELIDARMRERLAAAQEVSELDLRTLAEERAHAIQHFLVEESGIDRERIYQTGLKLDAPLSDRTVNSELILQAE